MTTLALGRFTSGAGVQHLLCCYCCCCNWGADHLAAGVQLTRASTTDGKAELRPTRRLWWCVPALLMLLDTLLLPELLQEETSSCAFGCRRSTIALL